MNTEQESPQIPQISQMQKDGTRDKPRFKPPDA